MQSATAGERLYLVVPSVEVSTATTIACLRSRRESISGGAFRALQSTAGWVPITQQSSIIVYCIPSCIEGSRKHSLAQHRVAHVADLG